MSRPSDEITGVFKNLSTMQVQIWLKGKLLGACCLSLGPKFIDNWLASSIKAEVMVKMEPNDVIDLLIPSCGAKGEDPK